MAAARLVRQRRLDPRPADVAARQPIADSVNIPFAELPDRVYELPPREQELAVVGPASLVHEVVAWLTHAGRRATVLANQPPPAAPPDPAILGHLWEPNAFLAETLPDLPVGRVLELACGTGRDAIFMSAHGWPVTAVDVLPDALDRARALAARYAPALQAINWQTLDLEIGTVRFEQTYDLLTVFRYLHRPLFPHFREWLRPGGSILYETYTTVHRERYGRPARAAHVLQPGELPELLPGFEIRHHSEAWRAPPASGPCSPSREM
jgi:tellurite methyltransferase